ncbi:MAG: ABC transporter permease subunit [Eubacterium sp.]|nr:ABC transporter permease subunit [Eubacterium sp.]
MTKKNVWGLKGFLIAIVLLVPLIIGISWGVVIAASDSEPEFDDFSELSGKKIAMLTGAPFEELISSKVPNVGEFQYFANMPDMELALKSKKIDAYLMNNAIAELTTNVDDEQALFSEPLADSEFGFAFKKGSKERDKWQEAYDNLDDELIDELWDKWTGSDYSAKTIPEQDWPGKNGTVKVATCDTLEPMCYLGDDGQLVGFDIEVMLLIAKELDVHVEFIGMEFAAIMPYVQSGKADAACGSIIVTDERKESMDFVNYHYAAFVLVVRAVNSGSEKLSFWDGIKSSFNKTFIRGKRYKLILEGLGRTLIIAVLSGALGTLLGFLLVFARRRNNRVVNRLIAMYKGLITGVPVVVILMLLYYVLFGKTDISAVIVAIIGFTIIFGSRAFGLIWNAVENVDKGQREAALALGYSESKAFRRVVLPQARGIYFPVLKTQLVMLLKETSIAGFITVVDLTRAGDLIRSRTMEAFFPLIAIAIIYFLLTFILAKILGLVDKRFVKKRKNVRIKGVD